MPKPTKGPRLGAGPDHERLMLAGLAAALFREERIRTTVAKAKRLRPLAERLVTLGKKGTVQARRQALAVVGDRDVVHTLFADIAPRYAERNGGYTRILRLGLRKGDAAPMALIELVEGEASPAARAAEAEPGRRGLLRRRARAAEEAAEGRRGRRRAEAPETEPETGEATVDAAPPEEATAEAERTEESDE